MGGRPMEAIEAREPKPRTRIRPARREDAASLAILIDMAAEGMASWVWAGEATNGQTPYEVGRQRARREEGGFSYRNSDLIEIETADGPAIAGFVMGYRLADPYVLPDLSRVPEHFRPLVELEAQLPGAWYLNAIAVFSEYRRVGIGERLMRRAEERAIESGARVISLIWAEENVGAGRLYRRLGYRDSARRPIVPFPGIHHGGDWVLLAKPVAGS